MTRIHGDHVPDAKGFGKKMEANHRTGTLLERVDKEIRNIKAADGLSEEKREKLLNDLQDQKHELKQKVNLDRASDFNTAIKVLDNVEEAREDAAKIAKNAAADKAGQPNQAQGSSGTTKIDQPEMRADTPEVSVGESEEAGGSSGASEAGESGASGKSKEDVSQAYEDFEAEAFADEMMENPEAAMDQLDGMNFKEKQMALQEAQMFMQQIQRMTKLQSNLASMAHKTSSAVIQNIR